MFQKVEFALTIYIYIHVLESFSDLARRDLFYLSSTSVLLGHLSLGL